MSKSLAEIGRIMDQVGPPPSLRELAGRHRWPNGLPPVISLRYLDLRHSHPATTLHRMLALNTYLIHGMQLSLCNAIHIGRILAELGPTVTSGVLGYILPEEIIDKWNIGTKQLATVFGLATKALTDAFPSIATSFTKEVTKWLPWPVGEIIETVTKPLSEVTFDDMVGKISPGELAKVFEMRPDEIVAKIGLDAGEVAAAFCDRWIGYLSDATGYPLDFTIDIKGGAPDRTARAKKIGAMLARDYDLTGLCEVFEPDKADDLLDAAGATGRTVAGHPGAAADGELAGSGLLTVTFDGRSSEGTEQTQTFSAQGKRLRDADAWSRKGVLLTKVDIGLATIDLYIVHLFEGGDVVDVSDEDKFAIQLSQINDVVDFITETHQPDRIAVLMGDMNVDAGPPEYAMMMERLATLGLVDLWPFWSQLPDHPAPPLPRGATNDPDICEGVSATQPFCIEPGKDAGRRIDYVFIERPREHHPFTIDCTRPRRRTDLDASVSDGRLADHLGLDVGLIVAPIVHLPA
jgi:endonuclease/exonuclease/phosphatase family metal-dependent hydrolase